MKTVVRYDKLILEKQLDNLSKFMYDIGYLYFIMLPYYTFGKYIEKINSKKCFMLFQLFETLSNIDYLEFSYNKEKIISKFIEICISGKEYL